MLGAACNSCKATGRRWRCERRPNQRYRLTPQVMVVVECRRQLGV